MGKKVCTKKISTILTFCRRLTYSRALEIVQEEEYLTEADRSIIRRTGGPPLRGRRRRVKRQFPFLNVSVVPDLVEVDDTRLVCELIYPGTVSKYDSITREYSGYCPVALLSGGGLLLPGNPRLGTLRQTSHKHCQYLLWYF